MRMKMGVWERWEGEGGTVEEIEEKSMGRGQEGN